MNLRRVAVDGLMSLSRYKTASKNEVEPRELDVLMPRSAVAECLQAESNRSSISAGTCSSFKAGSDRTGARALKYDETGVFSAACEHYSIIAGTSCHYFQQHACLASFVAVVKCMCRT
jgi:hypothetical protein